MRTFNNGELQNVDETLTALRKLIIDYKADVLTKDLVVEFDRLAKSMRRVLADTDRLIDNLDEEVATLETDLEDLNNHREGMHVIDDADYETLVGSIWRDAYHPLRGVEPMLLPEAALRVLDLLCREYAKS